MTKQKLAKPRKRTGVDTPAAVRKLLKIVHELPERVAALERTQVLRDKLANPLIMDEPYYQQRAKALDVCHPEDRRKRDIGHAVERRKSG